MFSPEQFENECRAVARHLWRPIANSGAFIMDGRERDGVFETDEIIYVLEATTRRDKEKIEHDAKKTDNLVKKMRKDSGKFAKGYIVTLHEPTAHQRDVIRRDYSRTVEIVSFDQFRARLFDAKIYLEARRGASFGSIYDYEKETYDLPRTAFIEPTICDDSDKSIAAGVFAEKLLEGGRFLLHADYGVGKSMVLREIFFLLRDKYLSSQHLRVPIYINLREHLGQKDAVELIERHARAHGCQPHQLVQAWRAGYVDLLLDGFDEIASRGWVGNAERVRELRRSTHTGLRQLIRETPQRCGIAIAGRLGYFDTTTEARDVLGLTSAFRVLTLQPFNSDQVEKFLRKNKLNMIVPDWVPARPLLLGYLVAKRLIREVSEITVDGPYSRGGAWSALLRMIARRESEQLEGTEPETILRFIQRLAILSKHSEDGRRKFSPIELENVFFEMTGKTPVDDDRLMLLRLPGLGTTAESASTRAFVDTDFADAAAAGELFEFVLTPYERQAGDPVLASVSSALGDTGLDALRFLVDKAGISAGRLDNSVSVAIEYGFDQIAFDLITVYTTWHAVEKRYALKEINLSYLSLEDIPVSGGKVIFEHSYISELSVPTETNESWISAFKFKGCLLPAISGRISENDLPEKMFKNCIFDQFTDSHQRNAEILNSDLPQNLKILLITLRKIFIQKGRGRREGALYRGLGETSRDNVTEIIDLLRKHGFINFVSRGTDRLWCPNRARSGEVGEILLRPLESRNPLVTECLRVR